MMTILRTPIPGRLIALPVVAECGSLPTDVKIVTRSIATTL